MKENDEIAIKSIYEDKEYTIFRDKKTGNLFVNSLKSGNVPKWFFDNNKEEIDFSKPRIIDIRDIDLRYFSPSSPMNEDVEWYRTPTQFIHFKHRIDLLNPNDNYFYDDLKYKVLNLIPTQIEGLEEKIYKYLNEKFGKTKLEKIIRKCVRYKLRDKQEW